MPIPYWAGHYIGLPFVEHGRSIYGLDCWGLVRLILFEQFDTVLPSYTSNYTNTYSQKEIGKLVRNESSKWHSIKLGEEKCGDVIVLRMRGEPMHVGCIIGDKRMLHIERHINSSIESYDSWRWKDRISGIFRHGELK